MDTNLILTNDQAAINAIRAAGANQLYVQKHSASTACTNGIEGFSLQEMATLVVTPGLNRGLATPLHLAL